MDWWKSFFDNSYGRLGLEVIDQERTDREVDFIIDALGLQKHERILDLACGMGRHSLGLARRRFKHITGLDLIQAYLDKAIAQAKRESLSARFVQGDMREIPFKKEFDAIFNFFTSFGFFEKREEDERVIESAASALKLGGRLLIETINRDWLIRNFSKQSWFEHEGDYVVKDHDFDLETSIFTAVWHFVCKDKKDSREVKIRTYSLHEMIAMFDRNGLKFIEAWGNTQKEPLTWDHNRLIVFARKDK